MEHFRTFGSLLPHPPHIIRPLCHVQDKDFLLPNYIIWHTCIITAYLRTDGAIGTRPSGRTPTFVTSISVEAPSVVLTRTIAARYVT